MGNSQTCADCNTKVPRKVKWLDNIGGDWGRRFSAWACNEIWIKLDHKKYLCSPCLVKRQKKERQKQQEIERREKLKKFQEEIERQEEHRRKKEAQRQLKEFQKEERRQMEEIDRRKNEAEKRQQEEDSRILQKTLQMQRCLTVPGNERKRRKIIMLRPKEVQRHKQEKEEMIQREKRNKEQAEEKRVKIETIQRNEEKRRLQEVNRMQITRLQNERKPQELTRREDIRKHESRLIIPNRVQMKANVLIQEIARMGQELNCKDEMPKHEVVQRFGKMQLEKRLQEEQKQMLQRKERIHCEKVHKGAKMRRLEEVRQLEEMKVLQKHQDEIRQKKDRESTRMQEEIKRQEIGIQEAVEEQIEERRTIIEIKHQLQDMFRQELSRVQDINRRKNEKNKQNIND